MTDEVTKGRARAALKLAIDGHHPDPYVFVAAAVFDVAEDRVTEEQRREAKKVCYTCLYDR